MPSCMVLSFYYHDSILSDAALSYMPDYVGKCIEKITYAYLHKKDLKTET